MNNKTCIAVDAMGGDFGPQVIIEGALRAAREKNICLHLVGDEQAISAHVPSRDMQELDINIVHASEVAGMAEKPSEILRRKKDSSIQVAFRLVKNGQAGGVVSAGNSGATLACGMFTLGRIKGIERPALASILPTEKRPMVLIDVGANVDCKPRHLAQFGLMAEVLAKDLLQIDSPRVGILSIGEEEGKGNAQVKQAYDLFKNSSMNFVGNVEGRDIYTGDVDVVVCDGFTGNVALKLSEGLANSLGNILKKELKRSFWSKLGTLLAMKSMKRFKLHCDYAEYGGAPLLGLKGFAMVCHGKSNSKSIYNAVKMASAFVQKGANEHLVLKLAANKDLTSLRRRPVEAGETNPT